MKRKTLVWVIPLVFLFLIGLFVKEGHAVPPFSRKYQVSCSLCHNPPPALNEFGEAFRLAGFRIPDGEEIFIKSQPVALEPEAYKKVWPEQIYPTTIPGLPAVGFRAIIDANIDTGGTGAARSTFKFPEEVEILTAGSFGDSASFFGEIEIEGGEVGTEPWVRFERIFGTSLLNLKAGAVGAHTLGLPGGLDSERTTRNRYLYGDWRMPNPGGFTNRNQFRLRNGQPGLELSGYQRSWKYALGVVNGNDGSVDDNNSAKDGFLQFAAKIGGIGYDGSKPAGKDFWSENSLQLGLFSYWGQARITRSGRDRTDAFYRLGPDIRFRSANLNLGAGYLFGRNNRPYGTLSSASVDSNGWFVDGIYRLYPWLFGALRYEGLRVDVPVGISATDDRRTRIVPSISALIRANIRFIAEGRFYTADTSNISGTQKNDGDGIVMRLDFAY
ncbi:MAG: hypothetical protein HYY46_01350 [Deltaproteobacteria bacterium]|nr:hypothetical protein [Deltaproteobacteria bacterium]